MRTLTRRLCLALAVAVLLAAAPTGWGQPASADEDQAKAMLRKGLAQFNQLDFKASQAALLKVDRTGLSETEKRQLTDYLSRIPAAIRKQAAARQAFANAQKALEANDLPGARLGFAAAAASELLPAGERAEARRQLSLIEQRMKAAAAAGARKPVVSKAAAPKPVAPKPAAPTTIVPPVIPPKPVAPKPAAPKTIVPPVIPPKPVAPKPAAARAVVPTVVPPKPVAPKPAPAPEPPPRSVVPLEVGPKPAVAAKTPAVEPIRLAAAGPPKAAPKTPTKTRPLTAKLQADQVKMKALIVEAKKALAAKDAVKAMGFLRDALAINQNVPEADEARMLLNRARTLAASEGSRTMISRYQRKRAIAKQAALVDFEKVMRRSQEVLARAKSPADFDAASGDARAAQNVLETHKHLFTEKEYRTHLTRVENQLKWIDDQRFAWNKKEVIRQQREMTAAELKRRQDQYKARIKQIQTLTHRAKTLRHQRKFSEAVDVLGQILELDPQNTWAAEWKQYLTTEVDLRDEHKVLTTRTGQTQRALLDVRDAEIPWWEILRYPADWKELTARREGAGAGAAAESEEDRRVKQKLQQKIAKLEFADIELKDVIGFLRDVTGLNIQVKWNALQVAGIDRTTAVNVHLTEVTAEKALRVILDDLGSGGTPLSYVVEQGVITVSTKEDLSRRTFVRVYDIRDMIIRVPNFRGPRIELTEMGNQRGMNDTGGGGDGGFFDEDEGRGGRGGDDERLEDELKTRAELIQEIITLIRETIDPVSWRAAGGEVGAVRELHGQLVVTQTSENHAALLDLINQLREARAIQIAIEARFIIVNTGFLNRIGIDLDFYFNIGSELAKRRILAAPAGVGVTRPYVVDPFTGTQIASPTQHATGVDATTLAGGGNRWGTRAGTNRFTPISVLQGSRDFISTGLSTGIEGDIGGAVTTGALGVAGTFLDDIQVDFLIEATQAHQTARTLTAPRITLFNGQRAYITVATQQAYVANYEPVVAENAAALRPIVGFVPTGTVLDVEATVSADRRYVTMTVRPQVAELIPPLDEITFGVQSGPDITVATIQLPTVTVQDLQTTVSVPDGGTLLLGGQKAAGELEREMGAPLLNKLPILNRLFSNRGKVRDESTLLILIKPKIIIQQEEEARAFPSMRP